MDQNFLRRREGSPIRYSEESSLLNCSSGWLLLFPCFLIWISISNRSISICYLPPWELGIVKNSDRALHWSPMSQFFSIRTDPKPVNKLLILSSLSLSQTTFLIVHLLHTHRALDRDRKFRTVLRAIRIARFVTMPSWKRKKQVI